MLLGQDERKTSVVTSNGPRISVYCNTEELTNSEFLCIPLFGQVEKCGLHVLVSFRETA